MENKIKRVSDITYKSELTPPKAGLIRRRPEVSGLQLTSLLLRKLSAH
jgi:hypothetical protein